MNLLDTLLPVIGLLVTLGAPTVGVVFSYRANRPYKVVGHSFELGMTAVRWRDDPNRTHWYTPDHLAQQIGQHR
ncbi:hypothetical protein ACBJ59_10420 [Nonomuraea sp. MTCD27]|uniref:hypothetical protein n=1 Tax=Nonomuraea sp. MTCD27 TaxID=1676747 RepID=UPI0035BF8FC3